MQTGGRTVLSVAATGDPLDNLLKIAGFGRRYNVGAADRVTTFWSCHLFP